MKKIYALLTLGSFLLAAGILAHTYAYPRLAVVPDDLDTTVVTNNPAGATATYFSIADLAETDAQLRNTLVARIDNKASAQATKETGREAQVVVLHDCTDLISTDCARQKYPISAAVQKIALDRETGKALPWSGSSIETGGKTETNIPVRGYTVKLPFNAKKTSYPMWNSDLRRTVNAKFVGEERLKGLRVYKFEYTVKPTVISTLDLPGFLVGSDAETVAAEQVAASRSTFLAEPETGVILSARSSQDGYAEIDGKRALTLVEGTFIADDKTVTDSVTEYKALSRQLFVLRVTFPIVGGIAGALFIALGLVLMVRRNRSARGARRASDDTVVNA